MRCLRLRWFLAVSITLLHAGIQADERDRRHGAIFDGFRDFRIEGAATLTARHAPAAPEDDEFQASIDMVMTLPAGPGTWTLYAEGSTTPRAHGIHAAFSSANADAGTALDGHGHGRLQISELHYGITTPSYQWLAGLIDVTGHLDLSEIANDETSQFLSVPLVNNPSIAFPDYTPGLAFHWHARYGRPGLALVVSGSHGIADDGGHYRRTLNITEAGEGLFLAGELYGTGSEYLWRTGLWTRTDDQTTHDGKGVGHARGVYGVLDIRRWKGTGINVRVGGTFDAVSEICRFVGLAFLQEQASSTRGLGLAWTRIHDSGTETLVEGFLRFRLREGIEAGPHLQWIHQPDSHGPSGWVTGLRLRLLF